MSITQREDTRISIAGVVYFDVTELSICDHGISKSVSFLPASYFVTDLRYIQERGDHASSSVRVTQYFYDNEALLETCVGGNGKRRMDS